MSMSTDERSLFSRSSRTIYNQWSEFSAHGFLNPVSGMIFEGSRLTCGMPLGAVDTGCIDLNGDGTWGYCTIFNSHVPRRGPINQPVLGMTVAGQTWLLTTQPLHGVDEAVGYATSASRPTRHADRLWYWGHYPAADIQYETHGAPVQIALRAWAPFVPGDVFSSTLPAAVFEVHLHNRSSSSQSGRLVFNFPGPSPMESGTEPLRRREFHAQAPTHLSGVEIESASAGYILAVQEETDVWTGDCLGVDAGAWGRIDQGLPTAAHGPGASISLPFELEPDERGVKRIFLTWLSPRWNASGHPDPANLSWLPWYGVNAETSRSLSDAGGGRSYSHMYARLHPSAWDTMQYMARHHGSLLERILGWQAVIYDEVELPGWLADALINVLHLITETGLWAVGAAPLGQWCRPDEGLFGMNEDPRHCPQIECVPCSFYGNYPVVYFFPQLARTTLRGYKAYQFDNGEVSWIFGGITDNPPTPPLEMASPTRGYQTTLNGPAVVDMVYRLWLRTQDDTVLEEFYDMVKKSTSFTMNLRPEAGPDGIISFPTGNKGLEWFEACTWAGMAVHVGGIHLANLRMAEAMAIQMGDTAFANQCHEWFLQGSHAMESKLWTGDYYLNYWEPETGRKSDLIMANQFDGEWMVRVAGLPSVFSNSRLPQALSTIWRTCVAATAFGAVNFSDASGVPQANGEGRPGWSMDPTAFFPPEVWMLGMTYIYAGRRDEGLDLCYRCWARIAELGRIWDQPNILRGDTGEVVYGGDYYQNMILWVLVAALKEQDLRGPARSGGLIERILFAANPASTDDESTLATAP